MTENHSGWHFTVHAPTEICTDEEWVLNSNIVLALVQRNDQLPYQLSGIEDVWFGRSDFVKSYLESKAEQIDTTPFEVRINSEHTHFFPLFSISAHTNEVEWLNEENFLQLSMEIAVGCPVIKVQEDLGLAAFVVFVKPFGDPSHSRLEGLSEQTNAQLIVQNLLVSETPFKFEISSMWADDIASTSAKVYERIFASYALEDRTAVECVESILQALGKGDLRWDLKVLRAGVNWEECVFEEISAADSFQLFWSEYASASINVRKEWMYALGLGRKHFIKPIYWKDPLPSPPKELEDIHFARVKLMV